MDAKIEIRGLPDFRRALKQIDDTTPSELKKGFLNIAESVAESVRQKVPKKSGRARQSIKARGSTGGASIAAGGTKAPYYPWLDFGGSVGKGHVVGVAFSGRIRRPFIQEGRYIYPTIAEKDKEIREEVDRVLEHVVKYAGFDTKGGE